MYTASEMNAAWQKGGRLVRPGLGEPTPTDRAEALPGASEAPPTAVPGAGAALPPSGATERPTASLGGEYAAFWQRVDETRRALAGFPDRAAACCRAWEKELLHNPNYPDGPGEEGGEMWTPCGAVSLAEEPGDREAVAAGSAGPGEPGGVFLGNT